MNLYIKDRSTFETVHWDTPSAWSIPISSALDDTGSATIMETDEKFVNDFAYIAKHIYVISEEAPSRGVNQLTLSDPSTIFDRSLPWPDDAVLTYGDFIAAQVTSQYINCSDSDYAISYLDIVNSDHTPFTAPELDDTKLYVLSDIIADAQERGVKIEYTIANKRLLMTISTREAVTHKVFFNEDQTELSTETYSNDITAKVTVLQKVEDTDPQEYTETTWYLSTDGNLSNTVPANRAKGKWVYATSEADEEPLSVAESIIADNVDSHKIEFYSDRQYNLWDAVKLRLANTVFDSHIVAITQKHNDNRFLYRCGALATTLTEKVNKGSNTIVTGSGGKTGNAFQFPVGYVWISVDATNPADVLGYGTWEQITGRFLLAADASHPAGSTGGEEKHALTIDEMPSHTHGLKMSKGVGNYYSPPWGDGVEESMPSSVVQSTGGGHAHNNMPPYLSVYMFKRTA